MAERTSDIERIRARPSGRLAGRVRRAPPGPAVGPLRRGTRDPGRRGVVALEARRVDRGTPSCPTRPTRRPGTTSGPPAWRPGSRWSTSPAGTRGGRGLARQGAPSRRPRPGARRARTLLMVDATVARYQGDLDRAITLADRAAELGDRYGDPDLLAMAIHTQGLLAIAAGRIDEGVGLLDEAMASVLAGNLTPFFTGLIYCNVIGACLELADVGRAGEWSDAARIWCDSLPRLALPGAVPREPRRGREAPWRLGRSCRGGGSCGRRADRLRPDRRRPGALRDGRDPSPARRPRRRRGSRSHGRGRSDSTRPGSRSSGWRRARPASRPRRSASPSTARRRAACDAPGPRGPGRGVARGVGPRHRERARDRGLSELASGAVSPVLTATAETARGALLLARSGRRAVTVLRRACATWRG